MSAQHTQGRLTVAGPTIQGGEDACGVPLALAHMLNPYAGAAGAADRVEANARRLVACWNACFGVETDLIEAAGDGLLAKALGRVGEKHDAMRFAEAQRDELQSTLQIAVHRIEDMLKDDDGQAFKEARKFIDQLNEKRCQDCKGGAA